MNKIDLIPLNTLNYRMMVREYNQYYSHFIFAKIFQHININKKKNVKLDLSRAEIQKELKSSRENEYIYGMISKNINFNCFLYKCGFDKKIFLSFFKEFKFINIPLKKKKINLTNNINTEIRNIFFKKIINKNKKGIENFLFQLSFFTFPKSFLENFDEIYQIANKINWPSKPKFILTSYGQYNDEFFKSYCAQKILSGAKLLIFQHGAGGIFADKEFYGQRYDLNIAHKFYSWGKNRKENSRSFFYNKKIISQSVFKFSNKKKILVILYQLNESVVFPPNGFLSRDAINRNTFTNFKTIRKNLRKKIFKNFKVRILDGSLNNKFKPLRQSIKKNFPDINFSNNNLIYNDILKNYNLVLHFRVSTAFFESIFYNIPTILILDKSSNINFDKKFSKVIGLMIKKNMVFLNLNLAKNFINENYFSINEWWNREDLRKLRLILNENYCRNFDKNKLDFKNLFQF